MNAAIKLIAGVALLGALEAQAVVVVPNDGFENPLLPAEWTINTVNAAAAGIAQFHTYVIDDGFGTGLEAGGSIGAVQGSSFLRLGGGDANIWQTVTSTNAMTVNAGEKLYFWSAFDWGDNAFGAPDAMRIRILDAGNAEVAVVRFDDGNNHLADPFHDGGWQSNVWAAAASGSYKVEFGVLNAPDAYNPSYGLFDVSAVPEPETYALMLAGLGLVGWMARRRKQ